MVAGDRVEKGNSCWKFKAGHSDNLEWWRDRNDKKHTGVQCGLIGLLGLRMLSKVVYSVL